MSETKLISMKRSNKDKRKDMGKCAPIDCIAPDYPWGLCLNLESDELDKLGLTNLPKVGTEMPITATVKVTRVSQSASENGGKEADEHRSVSLQITAIAIG